MLLWSYKLLCIDHNEVKKEKVLRSTRYLLMVLFAMALAAPKPVWAAQESPGATDEKATTRAGVSTGGASVIGRGEGFEPS
jgi:hypothetical protein